MPGQVVIFEYDPHWPRLFEHFRSRLAAALSSVAVAIEHVGSTAVPGLSAKPVIDIDVLLSTADRLPDAIERLSSLRYRYEGDLGIAGREAFAAPYEDPPHHLYVCPPDSLEFERHIGFRDYLRAHPAEAKAYGDLKNSLALRFPEDRNAYVAGKSKFVTRLTERALRERRSGRIP